MDIEFDPDKEQANRQRHGLSLALGAQIVRNAVTTLKTTRFGEDRYVAFSYIDGRLHVCVYTVRETAVRIISVRKASKQEEQRYG